MLNGFPAQPALNWENIEKNESPLLSGLYIL